VDSTHTPLSLRIGCRTGRDRLIESLSVYATPSMNVERVVLSTLTLTKLTKGDMIDDEEEDGGETASVRNMTT
jgi:hypothetical protein